MQYQFVSGDDHMDLAYIPARMWQERVPAKLKDQAPRVEETPQGRRWVCEGKPWAFGDYGTMRGARLTGAIPRAGVADGSFGPRHHSFAYRTWTATAWMRRLSMARRCRYRSRTRN